MEDDEGVLAKPKQQQHGGGASGSQPSAAVFAGEIVDPWGTAEGGGAAIVQAQVVSSTAAGYGGNLAMVTQAAPVFAEVNALCVGDGTSAAVSSQTAIVIPESQAIFQNNFPALVDSSHSGA